MTTKIKDKLKITSKRSYLDRDFEGFRSTLIEHARIFYPDKIQDFSEPSFAGLLVDLAATVGDHMSYYLDHQFRELDPSRAVEINNIRTHLANAGVDIVGASPAATNVTIQITTPAAVENGKYVPLSSALPFILADTSFESSNGISFNLLEDLDFSERDLNNNLVAKSTFTEGGGGTVGTTKVTRTVPVVSGVEAVETFVISDDHVPFREIQLSARDVSTIMSVIDSDGNEYYQVKALSQDTIFEESLNLSKDDFELVPKTLEVRPAPRRFVASTSPASFITTLRFGSGNAQSLDDDIAPDPSELALSLYGKKNFPKFSIDPNALVDTQTLGISPRGTTLTVTYRHGGGLSHNVDVNTIRTVSNLSLEFRKNPTPANALSVRQSISVTNPKRATGGSEAPDIEFLRNLIAPSRNAQSRIVTREDLLARIYTLPAQFGRVFRVGLSENVISQMSLVLHVISLDATGNLAVSPDTLKENLSTYLNEFRLISDALDVIDAKVINYKVRYQVYLDKKVNKQTTLLAINRSIADATQIKYFQIDQPIIVDDIRNVIINTQGVISIDDLEIIPISGVSDEVQQQFGTGDGGRIYSTHVFSTGGSIKKGILRGPTGSIFELRYPENDITGYAV